MDHKRKMYRDFCQDEKHLCHDIKDLKEIVKGMHFDGIIGGIPCQSRSKLRAIRKPKFGDLLPSLLELLEVCSFNWALFENVSVLDIPGFKNIGLNAVNFGKPHQSRLRYFTYTENLGAGPQLIYNGTIDELMAYPAVVGRTYGPYRGARLQGWPRFYDLNYPCVQKQEALADGVPRCLADAWIKSINLLK